MLDAFKEKYKPIKVFCSEAEKDALIKKLGDGHIIHFAKNRKPTNENDEYVVAYIPKMTPEDRKALNKLKGDNAVTARKLMTWNIVNVRNQKMLKELGSEKRKTIKFKGDQELELYDMTERDDYVWLVHTEPSSGANLKLVAEQMKDGTLWNKFPFLSCCLQDGFTESYAGSQSIAHTGQSQAIPISFILEVDPNAIISTEPFDAKTPEGLDKTAHLGYIQPKLAERLEKEKALKDTIPKGTVAELHSAENKGLLGAEELIKKTKGYNEVTIMSGELAKDWGINPPTIKGIVIEKHHVDKYLSEQDRLLPHLVERFNESLTGIIHLAKSAHLPVILIETKPKLKTQLEEANELEELIVPGTRKTKANYLKKEVQHHINAFKDKLDDTTLTDADRTWHQRMFDFLQKVQFGAGVTLPKINSVEEQVLLNIIIADAKLDASVTEKAYVEKALETEKEPESRAELLTWASTLEKDKSKAQDALNKAQKELKHHNPQLNFDVEALSNVPKNKK